MRRLLIILAVFALMVAACDPGDDTEGAETTAAGTTSPTPDAWPTCFKPAAFYSEDEACANLDPEESEVRGQEAEAVEIIGGVFLDTRPNGDPLDHFCEIQEDHVFVVLAQDFNPADFSLEPVSAEQLSFTGELADEEAESAEAALGLYAELQLGLFLITDGAEVLTRVDEIQESGFEASPHYVLAPTPTWKYGPHTTVETLTGWHWSQLPTTGEDASGSRVVVIDTGALGDPGAEIGVGEAEPEGNVPNSVQGHGVFAASIVKQFNHSLSVDLYRAGFMDGTLTEASVTAALVRAGPVEADVVNLSLGTYICAEEYGSLGLTAVLSNLDDTVHIVAASGNDAESDPNHPTMYPAILGVGSGTLAGQITAVGALDVTGNRAVWSNAAEVEAPGENLVGWYHDGNTGGLAVWSGTSFAAPHFAACLASGLCEMP